MKEALETARKFVLCGTAQHSCGLMRKNFAVLTFKDVQPMCVGIATLCKAVGCKKPASYCLKAAKAETEEEFLKFHQKSCEACDEQRTGKVVNGSQQNPIAV